MANDMISSSHTEPLTNWAPPSYPPSRSEMKYRPAADQRVSGISPTFSLESAGESSNTQGHPRRASPKSSMESVGEPSNPQSGFNHMSHAPPQHGYMAAYPPHLPPFHLQPQHMQGHQYSYPVHGGSYLPMGSNDFTYATPSRQPHPSHPSSMQSHMAYNGTTPQHATATMAGRPANGPMTMPPRQGQTPMWANHANDETPTRQPAQTTRKGRPKKQAALEGSAAGPSSTKTPKAKQKRLSVDSGDSSSRAAKRVKKNHNPQLPTPPASGDASNPINTDVSWDHRPSIDTQSEAMSRFEPMPISAATLARHPSQTVTHAAGPPVESAQIDRSPTESRLAMTEQAHQSAAVIRHTEEGRRLAFGPVAPEEGVTITYEPPNTGPLSPRYVSAPALTANESGMVSVDTNDVLESEIAWLDDRPQTPRSTANDSAILRTPVMSRDAYLAEDDRDTPKTRADKRAKRLSAFNATTSRPASSQWTTRIENMGRVAFTKSFATKFLGLTSDIPIVEETSIGNVVENPPDASPTLPANKPDWPDAEAPWSTALNSRSTWIASDRKAKGRAARLEWYVGEASDDSSDEEAVWGKSTARTAAPRFPRPDARFNNTVYRQRTLSNWEAANDNATSALLLSLRNRPLRSIPDGAIACLCGSRDVGEGGTTIRCDSCQTWHHIRCYNMNEVPHGYHYSFFCDGCKNRTMAVSTPARTPRNTMFHQSDERSSALKGPASDIALAPSPLFTSFNNAASHSRTPLGRAIASASSPSRAPRARMLSYDNDIQLQWSEFLHDPVVAAPSTPVYARSADRFSTPKIEDVPFDVTSTPSRHIDFNIGQPSLFSLTPLNGRSRVPSGMLTDHMTPFRARNVSFGQPLTEMVPSKHGFLNDLGRGGNGSGPSAQVPHSEGAIPASPSNPRWPLGHGHTHGLMGAPHVSPSPFGHRRTASGNKMSSLRSSSKAGLGSAMGDDGKVEEEEEEEE